jgi:drug/metabolite transporter (DMT)-like permease
MVGPHLFGPHLFGPAGPAGPAGPLLFSAAITASQTISKGIPFTVFETNVIRFAAVGALCAMYLFVSPAKIKGASCATILLSVLTGLILFSASALYIHLVRTHGLVSTCITTTSFSFLFTVLAGRVLLKEHVAPKTMAAMAVVLAGVALHHI